MYEIHVTIEPVFGDQLQFVKDLGHLFNFQIAELLMVKRPKDTPERSKLDSFLTAHSHDYDTAEGLTRNMVRALKANDVKVWRYKIERIIVDSKYQDDPWGLL